MGGFLLAFSVASRRCFYSSNKSQGKGRVDFVTVHWARDWARSHLFRWSIVKITPKGHSGMTDLACEAACLIQAGKKVLV